MADRIAEPEPSRLRDDADFRRYWWSRLLSTTGTIISYIALPVLVYRISGSALLTALVTAMETAVIRPLRALRRRAVGPVGPPPRHGLRRPR